MCPLVEASFRAAVTAGLFAACSSTVPSAHIGTYDDAGPRADASDAGRTTPYDASETEGDGRRLPHLDAGSATSPTDDLPRRGPDSGAPSHACGALERWIAPERLFDVSVVRGGDGFAGVLSDASSGEYDFYVFDASGNATLRLGRLFRSSPTGYGLREARAGGDVVAAIAECSGKGFGCGSVLVIAGEHPITIQPAQLISANPHAAMTANGDIFVANLVLPDVVGPGTDLAGVFHDGSYDVRLLDHAGHLSKTSVLKTRDFVLRDVATGRAGTILLFDPPGDQDAGDGNDQLLVSLDENLKQRDVAFVPAGRIAESLVMTPDGKVVMVGTAIASDGARLWLDAFDAATLKEAWSTERVGDPGVGIAVDVSASEKIATLAITDHGGGIAVRTYDAEGMADSDAPLVVIASGDLPQEGSFNPGIAVQSDGSLFVTSPIGAFVYCPQK